MAALMVAGLPPLPFPFEACQLAQVQIASLDAARHRVWQGCLHGVHSLLCTRGRGGMSLVVAQKQTTS